MAKARFRCCRCGLEWDGDVGPADPCAFCGSLYCVWVNYADFALHNQREAN